MDMQKEREAFEAYLLDQGVELKYLPSICFNGSEYDLEDDGDDEYQEALGEINIGWKTWQAAKASAVPDGYVVVPKEPPPRNRRAHQHEIDAIIEATGYQRDEPITKGSHEVGWAVLFAIETAMRLGEITAIEWKDVHIEGMYIHLTDTKNGLARNVPLSAEAERLLLQIKGYNHPRALKIGSDSLSTRFRFFRDKCGVEGLRFHDLRHEASTRMAQIIKNPADLAKITGHTDVNILVNTYYNPTPTEVAMRLRGIEE